MDSAILIAWRGHVLACRPVLDAIDMSTNDDNTAFTACECSIFGLTRRSCKFQMIKFRNETLTTATNTPSRLAGLWVRVV